MTKNKPDKLADDVSKAIAAGTSYGRWKAMQEPVKVETEIPEGWQACPVCGKLFKTGKGKKFCDIECTKIAYKERTREQTRLRARKYRARKKAEGQ